MAHIPPIRDRRDFLFRAGGGLGGIALASLLNQANASPTNPHAPKKPHHEAKAKSVIFMFMVGGPSPLDLFDPRPELEKWRGKPLPASLGKFPSQFTKGDSGLLPTTRKFKKHGKSGQWVSDLMPHFAECVDDVAFLKGCWCNSSIHAPAMYELHTGRTLMGHPSLGSWVTYGLGSVSDNLPAYCVMPQPEGAPEGGAPCWGAGYLPAIHQGTLFRKGTSPIQNLKPPATVGADQHQNTYDLVRRLNEKSHDSRDSELSARIASYELAYQMQQYAPEAVDLSRETEKTRQDYGLDRKETADFGTRLLLARRLVERGVRFVQVYSGGGPLIMQWDAHDDLNSNHEKMCGHVDQPIAALLKDLKRRGLLDETLVVWCSEFGRTPFTQGGRGRDHNPYGFTMWMAGGGVKGGQSVGMLDEFGMKAIKGKTSVNDFHATILHLLGLDHEQLTFLHSGRDERLTDVGGSVVEEIVG
jgi:hypothetical protein